jgi:hypothetical protein
VRLLRQREPESSPNDFTTIDPCVVPVGAACRSGAARFGQVPPAVAGRRCCAGANVQSHTASEEILPPKPRWRYGERRSVGNREHDPADAGEGSARRMALEHGWWRLRRTEDLARTAAWMITTATAPWRDDRLLEETARAYAERDPAAAMKWAASLQPSPANGRLTGFDQAGRRWMRTDRDGFEDGSVSKVAPRLQSRRADSQRSWQKQTPLPRPQWGRPPR